MVQIGSAVLALGLLGLVEANKFNHAPHRNGTHGHHHRQLVATCSLEAAGIDYVGNDIGSVIAGAASECCAKCSAVSGCRAFSWNDYNGGTCWLKSGKGATITTSGVQSGTVAQNTDDGKCTLLANLDYSGNDAGSATSASAGDCCSKCAARSGCKAYTWTPWNGGTCWFKSAVGNLAGYAGAYAGVVNPTNTPSPTPTTPAPTTPAPTTPAPTTRTPAPTPTTKPPSPGKCNVEQDVDYSGADVKSVKGSAGDCCEACSLTNGCGAYTWTDFEGGTCWLKRSKGAANANSGAVSGVLPQEDRCTLEQGVDYIGLDVGSANSESADGCCSLCSSRSGCGAFTWSSGVCYFKSHRGQTKANADVVSGVVTVANRPQTHVQYRIRSGEIPAKSVNLGSWLVGESWISFTSPAWVDSWSVAGQGEYAAMRLLGKDKGTRQFQQHWATWITENDIAEIAGSGLNCVRVPVGYWIVNDDPTTQTSADSEVFARGGLAYLDKLVNEWAVKYNIAVMLSLHAHQGSQNGYDHSAPKNVGVTSWSKSQANVESSLQLATYLAQRYVNSPAFLGMNMMNEPAGDTDQGVLENYYLEAYRRIRALGSDCILVTSPHLNLQGPPIMMNFMRYPQYYNVWHEFHIYYAWRDGLNADQILAEARTYRQNHLDNWSGNYMHIGEWSLTVPPSASGFNDRNKLRQLAETQMDQFRGAHGGWSFWTWRHDEETKQLSGWSMRQQLRERVFTVPQ
ncbi:hypothetical protein Poli38472_012320 [Pythium oligandrum]|uniref:glucan 1,3-beta-glucosidase n=1 Tax=Pythium oligandrum TaxID=41045 RepID=A0A8K1CQ61_PYTOL|nr:hypothetical protein Poli38472_012320 [Pythium oligandrum]|eukprot:TMW67204.1 hypothetical protein Poli38472_012320 [Pythium oligandrum]